jgi:hypothetical protein
MAAAVVGLTAIGDVMTAQRLSALAARGREPSDLRLSAGCQRPKSIVGLCSTSAAEHEPPPGTGTKGQ